MSSDHKTHKTESAPGNLVKHIKIVGFGKGQDGERFVKLRIQDGSRRRRMLLRTDDLLEQNLAKQITHLNRKGARLLSAKARSQFLDMLQHAQACNEFFVATKPGLCRGCFVLPNAIITDGGPPVKSYLHHLPPDVISKFRSHGTLEGAQQLAGYAKGNSRFILALGVAFSGLVAALTGNEAPAVQFVGAPGSGKTVLASSISAVWARRRDALAETLGGAEPWLHTLNNVDVVCTGHNDTLLIQDETRNSGAQVLDAVMRINGGIAKGRLPESSGRRSWRTPFISTSNVSVVDLLRAAKGDITDGAYLDRLIDIPLPEGGSGIFENLHGHEDVAQFARVLKKNTGEHFGLLGPVFVAYVLPLHRHAREELLGWIEERRQAYVKAAGKNVMRADRDLTRVHGRLATIYAACCLAAALGVIEFTRDEIKDAILKCEADHVRYVAEKVAQLNPNPPLQRFKEFVDANSGEFIDLRKKKVSVSSGVHPPGYFARKAGHDYALITDPALAKAVGGTAAASRLKHDLQLGGNIATTGGGKGKTRFSAKWPIPQGGRKTVRQHMIGIRLSALR